MKVICSYCQTYVGEKEPIEVEAETHGVCHLCYARLLQQARGISYDEFLETFDVPVLVINSQRRLEAANSAGLKMMRKPIEKITSLLAGQAMECAHSRLPQGCGKTVHCGACTLRQLMDETLESKRSQKVRSVTMKSKDGYQRLKVSTQYTNDGHVYVCIEDSQPVSFREYIING